VGSVSGLTVMIAHKRVQALGTIPLRGANIVDAPLQERGKYRKRYIALVLIFVIGNPLKVGIQLSRATIVFLFGKVRVRLLFVTHRPIVFSGL